MDELIELFNEWVTEDNSQQTNKLKDKQHGFYYDFCSKCALLLKYWKKLVNK